MINTMKSEAIRRLQEKLKKLMPGTYWFEIYDKAIDLALNSKRKEDKYFFRNLLRDAKKTLNRKNQSHTIDPRSEDENRKSIESLIDSGLSPLNKIIFQSYIDQIMGQCKKIHPFAQDVFSDLLDGVQVKVTADKLYISESLVKKLRVQMRQLSRLIIYN